MADKSKTNLFSTRNVLIGSGISLLLLAVWVIWYRNKRQELFNAILAEIRTPQDELKYGTTGTFQDMWAADFWDPVTYFKKPGISKPTIDIATAKGWVKGIYDAKGGLGGLLPDDEDAVIAAFQRAKNRSDVAKMADAFRIAYPNNTLKGFLQSFFQNKDSEQLFSLLKKLPV